MGVAALTSFIVVSTLLLYLFTSAVLSWRQRRFEPRTHSIRKQIMLLVICLFVADLIQSISGVVQLKWARENRVYEGATCTAQVAMITIGDLGSTVWSCVIASHTFSSIVLGNQWSLRAVYATIIVGWSCVGLLIGIAGGWCFITSNYSIQRLGIHYVPICLNPPPWLTTYLNSFQIQLFIAAIIIPVFYGLVFLKLRGNLGLLRGIPSNDAILRERVATAKRMLWYPAAFLTCMAPITIIRLVGMRNDHIPYTVWTFCVFVIFLLGAVDSLIYATTRELINPIRTSSLRRLNSTVSPIHPCGCPQKSESKDDGQVHDLEHHSDLTVEVPAYTSWNKAHPDESGPHSDRETTPSALEVHITLERIREVM